jgi:hypothetical protein
MKCEVCGSDISNGECSTKYKHIANILDVPLSQDVGIVIDTDAKLGNLNELCEAIEDPNYTNQFYNPDMTLPRVERTIPRLAHMNLTGHHPTKWTRLKVRMLVISGIPNDEIAKCMGISHPTLWKHYRQDIETGTAECIAMVTGKLMEKIRNGDNNSIIFFLRTRGRWNPKSEIEMTHKLEVKPRTRSEIVNELKEIGVPSDKIEELIDD